MRVFKDQASLAPDFASLPPEVIKKVYDNLDYQSANDLERTSKTIRTLIYDEQKRRREFLRDLKNGDASIENARDAQIDENDLLVIDFAFQGALNELTDEEKRSEPKEAYIKRIETCFGHLSPKMQNNMDAISMYLKYKYIVRFMQGRSLKDFGVLYRGNKKVFKTAFNEEEAKAKEVVTPGLRDFLNSLSPVENGRVNDKDAGVKAINDAFELGGMETVKTVFGNLSAALQNHIDVVSTYLEVEYRAKEKEEEFQFTDTLETFEALHRGNKQVVLTAIGLLPSALQYATPRLRNDAKFVMGILYETGFQALPFVGETLLANLLEDPEFVKQVPEEILKKILNPT